MTPTRRDIERMKAINMWIRILKIAAIAIGVWGALYLLGGDRDPEAFQPPMESSLGRTADMPRIVRMSGVAPTPDYTNSVTINYRETFDDSGIQFFELRFGQKTGGDLAGTVVSVMGDGDIRLIEWLKEHAGQRVVLSLQAEDKLTRGGQ